MYRKIYIAIVMIVTAMEGNAQSTASLRDSDLVKTLIANSPIKSGLTYDKLSQFYQTSVSTGDNAGFEFKSSWFALKRLFATRDLNLSKYYNAEGFSRNFEFGFGVHNNSEKKLSTVNANFKYALINKRSKSNFNFFADNTLKKIVSDKDSLVMAVAQDRYQKEVLDPAKEDQQKSKELTDNLRAGIKKFNETKDYKVLPEKLQQFINEALLSSNLAPTLEDFSKLAQDATDAIAQKIESGSLLTISFSPGYDYQKRYFDTTSVMLSYLVGLGKNYAKPWNLDTKIQGVFGHDTLAIGNNLLRHKIIGVIGVNKVLALDDKKNPLIEFELQAEDQWVTGGSLYMNELRHTFTMNSVLRFHVSRELTLPITFKYDIKNPNIAGIFRLQWNLENRKDK